MTARCIACDEGDPYAECTCTQEIERIDREAAEHDAMMAHWPLDFEPEEPTFPTPAFPGPCPECGPLLTGRHNPFCRSCEGLSVNARAVSEAWAWRCADTMPDSAQSRKDSEADGFQFRSFVWASANDAHRTRLRAAIFAAQGSGASARFQMTTRETWAGSPSTAFDYARDAAHYALSACPGLRGR